MILKHAIANALKNELSFYLVNLEISSRFLFPVNYGYEIRS